MLLLQRSDREDTYPGIWEIPGGKREPLETTEAALLREAKEETGLEVELVLPYSTFEYTIEKPTEIRDATQLNILCRVVGPAEVRLSDEHQASAWVTEQGLVDIPLTKNAARAAKLGFEVARKLGLLG